MNIIRVRKIVDLINFIILILCLGLFPFFIITTYKMNYNLYQQASDITKLVYDLDSSHKLNAKILFETLEFRRIEYRCYLGKENPGFLNSMNNTLKNYIKYVSNDPNLTPEQKKVLMTEVNHIEQAVKARIELTEKLVEYDESRKNYMDSLAPIVTENTTKYSQILNK